MGKGDKKTKRGKIFNGSYGARRPGKGKKTIQTGAAVIEKPAEVQEITPPRPRKKLRTAASQ